MQVETLDYDDLTEDEQRNASNCGSGKDMATYLRITYSEGDVQTESDAMEPEDASIHRDLSWIEGAIMRAYRQGLEDAQNGV